MTDSVFCKRGHLLGRYPPSYIPMPLCSWCCSPIPSNRQGRYCSQKCVGEARWEGKKKIRDQEVKRLYVLDGLSSPAIAKLLGVSPCGVRRALHRVGVELRSKTSLRKCRKCDRPAFKRLARNSSGQMCWTGGLCREHTLERIREKNNARRHPERGSNPHLDLLG